jgi:hypothetical protein
MDYGRMKVKCNICGLTWVFATPFTSVEAYIHTFLGDVSAEADV